MAFLDQFYTFTSGKKKKSEAEFIYLLIYEWTKDSFVLIHVNGNKREKYLFIFTLSAIGDTAAE